MIAFSLLKMDCHPHQGHSYGIIEFTAKKISIISEIKDEIRRNYSRIPKSEIYLRNFPSKISDEMQLKISDNLV